MSTDVSISQRSSEPTTDHLPVPSDSASPAQPYCPLRVLEVRAYHGPNLYAYRPVIRLELDLGSLEDHPTTSFSKPLEGVIGTLSIHDVRMHVLRRGSRFNLDDRRPWEPSK
jgi:hypothetical protein